MSKEDCGQWIERTIRVVHATFPTGDFANWERCEYYLPHVQVCASLIGATQTALSEAASLFQRAGFFLRQRARYSEAESLLRLALSIRQKLYVSDHLDTAETLNLLGVVLRDMSRFEESEQYLEKALAIREQLSGPEHLDVAETRRQLAELH